MMTVYLPSNDNMNEHVSSLNPLPYKEPHPPAPSPEGEGA
jgi:hypothetical protein